MAKSKIIDLNQRRNDSGDARLAAGPVLIAESKGIPEVRLQEQLHELRLQHSELLLKLDGLEVSNHELRFSNKKYHALYDNAPIAYLSLDRTGVITEINHTGAVMLGQAKSALNGKPLFLFFVQASRIQLAEHIAKILDGQQDSVELVLQGINCTYPVRLDSVPVSDDDGFISACSSAISDLSISRSNELILRESEQRFREFAEVAADWFWELDADLKYTYISERFEQSTGRKSGEVLGLTRQEVFRDAMHNSSDWEQHFHQLAARQEYTLEFELEVNKEQKFILEEGRPIYDMDGSFIGYRGVGRDITESKRHEQQLLRYRSDLEQQVTKRTRALEMATQESETFNYSVSHDLRAPLRIIDGFSHALLEDYGENLDAAGRNLLERVRAAGQRMGRLIDDMLRLSRLSRRQLRLREVDLSELAKQVSGKLHKLWPDRKVKCSIAKKLVTTGDPELLKVVLENLLDNAWKFTERSAKPSIELSCNDSAEDKNVYMVKDNGVGFDMHYIEKLFGAFQRLHVDEGYKGAGMGLAIVARIVHRHGGDVWAESEPDKGASFYFSLPKIHNTTQD